MKKKLLNISSLKLNTLLFFVCVSLFSLAQENSISPIFGLAKSNSAFENDLVAINQNLGKEIIIESFASSSFVGNNFTVSTQLSSNVDKLFVLKNSTSLAVYDLPYFFDPNYSGEQTSLNLSSAIDDLDYHQSNAAIYAYNLNANALYSLSPNSGTVTNTNNIPFNSSLEHFSLNANEEYIVLCGQENDSTKLLFHHITSGTNQNINLNTLYNSFYIVSHFSQSNMFAVAQDLNKVNWLLRINPSNLQVETISALPSCSNCNTESFSFKQNALAIDWETNSLLAVLNQEVVGVNNFSLINVDLSNGEVKNFAALEREINNLYYNKAAADLVFPGDANHDGIVNTRDLLPIGLRYSYNTTPRFTQSSEWIGQHSFNTGIIAQGADIKHADCNGDGQINDLDIDVIKANYSSVHNSNKSTSATGTNCDYPLAFSFIETAFENNEVSVNVKLGEVFDPVLDVYGVSFTVAYDNSFVVPNSMQTIGLNSWFGNDGNNSIHTSNDDFLNGEFEITITGVDLLNRSGGGDIIGLSWTMEDDVMPIAQQFTDMNLRIENPYIINLAEVELESCGSDTSLQVTRKDAVGIRTINDNFIDIFPNPAQEKLNIVTDESIETVALISLTGAFIQSLNINKEQAINVSSISKGVYLLQINTKDRSYFEKIVID